VVVPVDPETRMPLCRPLVGMPCPRVQGYVKARPKTRENTRKATKRSAQCSLNWNTRGQLETARECRSNRQGSQYLQLLEEMAAAGYAATEWASRMPWKSAVIGADRENAGAGFWGVVGWSFAQTRQSAGEEVQRGVEIGNLLQSLGDKLLIAADRGETATKASEPGRCPSGGRADRGEMRGRVRRGLNK